MTRRQLLSMCAAAGTAWSAPVSAISDDLRNWNRHAELKPYARGFEWLQKTDLRSAKPGRIEIDGDRMFATVSEAASKPLSAGKFEAHRRYLDIHYLLAGAELIGAVPGSGLKVTQAYDASKEIEFYATPVEYRTIALRPGQFAVFAPGEAHMPGCGKDPSTQIRKVVVKILVA